MSPTAPNTRRHLLWALFAGLLLVVATAVTSAPAHAAGASGDTPPGKAWIRAGHFVPGFGAARVDLRPTTGAATAVVMSPSASYGDVTSYQKLAPGTYTVSIWNADAPTDSAPLLSRSFTAVAGKAQTIAVIGTEKAPRLAVLSDDLTPPKAGAARVRVLSASSLAPSVDVTAVKGPSIASDAVLGSVTRYATVPAGRWTLDLTGSSMSSRQSVALKSGSVYTAVALDSGSTAVRLELVTDAAGATATPVGSAATGFGGAALSQDSGTSSLRSGGVLGGALVSALLLAAAGRRSLLKRGRRTAVGVDR